MTALKKIVSGGQTGVDQAALEWAITRDIPHGGWCPKGRLTESGTIPAKFHLQETPKTAWNQRTEWNVRDSDGTALFTSEPELKSGTKNTEKHARILQKPCLHLCPLQDIDPDDPQSWEFDVKIAAGELREFVEEHQIKVLNVAGPRASGDPTAIQWTKAVLESTF